MIKMKAYFLRKEDCNAYDNLTLMWPCVESITQSLIALLPISLSKGCVADAVQSSVVAYNQQVDWPLNDWERLAVYFITLANFVTEQLGGKMGITELTAVCPLPRRLNSELINAVADKLALRILHA
ncbi:TPA: hypothetical protein RG501_RS12940 [Providencia rettgeri]|nr:hypothetical protein [Providencia rettgeri]